MSARAFVRQASREPPLVHMEEKTVPPPPPPATAAQGPGTPPPPPLFDDGVATGAEAEAQPLPPKMAGPPGSPQAMAARDGLAEARRRSSRRASRLSTPASPAAAAGEPAAAPEERFLEALMACDDAALEVGRLPDDYVAPRVRAKASSQRLSEAAGPLLGEQPGAARTVLRAKADMGPAGREGGAPGGDQQLRVRRGELFALVSRREEAGADDGWWIGERCGVEGLFPARLAEELPPEAAGKVMRTVVARANGGDEDYLAYQEGELLEIVSQPAADMWIGVLRGVTGIFSAADAVYHSLVQQPSSQRASVASASPTAPSERTPPRTPPRSWASLEGSQGAGSSREAAALPGGAPGAGGDDSAPSLPNSVIVHDSVDSGITPAYMNVRGPADAGSPPTAGSAPTSGAEAPTPPPPGASPATSSTGRTASGTGLPGGAIVPTWAVPYSELELLNDIGHGGFSTVSKAMWRGEVVAVKRLNQVEGSQEGVASKLLQEAEVNAALSHRNIVQFRGACMEAPHFCLIMEYVDRGPLHRQLTTTLEPATLVDWASQIAKGMNYLHEEAPTPIIHRDLKSSNVLLSSTGVLKITDFGLARAHAHTTRMSAAGTFAWMSPEVIRSSMYSKGADVW